MLAANTPVERGYHDLLSLPLTVKLGAIGVDKPLLYWINDGLMALFFLLVGLELKREAVEGQFADRRQLIFPAACALGGMVVPMAFYAAVNHGDATGMRGLAIPAGIIIQPGINGYAPELDTRLPFDPNAAKALLAAADYPDGFAVTLDCPNDRYVNDEAICRAAAAMLAEIGDLHAGIDDAVFAIDELLEWAERDEAAGAVDDTPADAET